MVLLFKVGDAFANKLFTPFMMDMGFSKTEIALIVKALFTVSTLVGSVLGGVLMVRLGLLRSMLIFGVLQALTNLLYCALALAGKSYPIMVLAVVLEHVAGAMGGIALVALIMALCDVRYSAFQYALLSALALLPRYSLGYPAGWIADHGAGMSTTSSASCWRCRDWRWCGSCAGTSRRAIHREPPGCARDLRPREGRVPSHGARGRHGARLHDRGGGLAAARASWCVAGRRSAATSTAVRTPGIR